MKQTSVFCLIPCLLFTSCASIVSKSQCPVAITSNPSGAKFTVKNKAGEPIHQGVTPCTVTLPASAGYFQPANYSLEFTKKGSATQTVEIKAGINGWYFGNIVFGGLIGIVIVDPLTGAMWRLDDTANANLPTLATLETKHGGHLRIVDRASVPSEVAKHLIALR